MPFIEQEDDEMLLLVASDIHGGGDAKKHGAEVEEGAESSVVTLDEDENGNEEIDDEDEAAASLSAGRESSSPLSSFEEDIPSNPTPNLAANSSRKRKAADKDADAETPNASDDVTLPRKRGRPSRAAAGAAASSARLAAKAAAKPTRGRPKVTATATSTKPSRGRPASNPAAVKKTGRGAAKTASKGPGRRGRPRKSDGAVHDDEWEVEAIIDSGIDADSSEHKYFVKWKGYGAGDNTWEPKSNLAHCMDLVRKFDARSKSKAAKDDDRSLPGAKPSRGRKPRG